jgi:serine/threonine protein kinase
MEVLSPRPANVPTKSRSATMKKATKPREEKPPAKPTNPDRIDDKWRPPTTVTEPGGDAETYIPGRKLGKGGFAVCFEGESLRTKKIFALKVVKAKVEQRKMMEKFRTELQIHAKMGHPNIVEFLRAFTSDNYTYVVLELCSNGNLTDMVRARSCLSLPEVRRMLIQICGGVRYMHKRSVIHRDLKMGNVFLDEQMNIKVGDFGLAAVMADEQDRRTTLCGTPNYIAPEILSKSGTRGHDNKVDTWAIGVMAYAMLVGTPPFQSKTQQEIYTKLRSLEYEWKIDCKNYIPQQAKDVVASCLNLNSAERPDMDDLVEHEFFTMGAIADTLDSACLKAKPEWLLNADPRGDRVKSGYGVTHSNMCRASGVGRKADGSPRPGVGEKHWMSTLIEIEAENQTGSAPTIPLPEGILYSAISEQQAEEARQLQRSSLPTRVKSRKPVTSELGKISEEQPGAGRLPGTLPLRPSMTVPSFAATQRQQAVPQRHRLAQVVEPKREQVEPEPAPADSQGLLRARPVRAATVRATRSMATQNLVSQATNYMPDAGLTLPPSEPISAMPRPGRTTAKAATIGRSTAQSTRSMKLASMGDNATLRPSSVASRYSDEGDPQLQPKTSSSSLTKSESGPRLADRADPVASLSIAKKALLISPTDPHTYVKNSANVHVLADLRNLHEALNPRPGADMNARSGSRRMKARIPYPRVDKWVDYSGRHGMAYLLTDGTMGMIKKQADPSEGGGCVVVRNAKIHAINRARGVTSQVVPQGKRARAVEFYAQSYDDMMKLDVPSRKFLLDAQKHSSQAEAIAEAQTGLQGSELERFKEVGLLDKLGKYMNKKDIDETMMDEEDELADKSSQHFIHFYQRLGNVTVWRFADGGMQFNFPDHTKLIVYKDCSTRTVEYCIDLIYLEPGDAREVGKNGRLTRDALERRDQMTLGLADVMGGSLRTNEADVVKSNEIREKLQWIRAVLSIWIREGGVGFMGEEKVGWSGLQEKRDEKRSYMQWVTVGKLGGDA